MTLYYGPPPAARPTTSLFVMIESEISTYGTGVLGTGNQKPPLRESSVISQQICTSTITFVQVSGVHVLQDPTSSLVNLLNLA